MVSLHFRSEEVVYFSCIGALFSRECETMEPFEESFIVPLKLGAGHELVTGVRQRVPDMARETWGALRTLLHSIAMPMRSKGDTLNVTVDVVERVEPCSDATMNATIDIECGGAFAGEFKAAVHTVARLFGDHLRTLEAQGQRIRVSVDYAPNSTQETL